MMRFVSRTVLALAAMTFASCAVAEAAPPADRPNIILIMTDDQGYGDLGATGNTIIETPNINAMAKRSVTIDRFYVSPVCTPTRACLMTGRYNFRTRAIDTYRGRAMMDTEETTIAEVLRDTGYTTGIFGKWHLGDNYPLRPIDQGFDEALVHRGGGIAQPSEPIENNNRYTNPILIRNGEEEQTEGYCTDVYFRNAIRFMKEAKAKDKPFFVYLPDNVPHGPFHDVPRDLYEKYKAMDLSPILRGNEKQADTVARVFAMIENVDRNMGILFDELDAMGITDNTIVIFMCDNGPNTVRYVGKDLRGMKSNVHEGGIRSPFFMQWPAQLKAGTKVDRIAAHIDVMPTLLEAAHASVPKEMRLDPKQQMDGRSLLPLLRGDDVEWPDRKLFIQTHRGDEPVARHHFAVIGRQWKLLRASGFGREQPPADTPYELYDISQDPGEQTNLYDERRDIVQSMLAMYDQWFNDVSSTRPDNYAPPRIVIGSGDKPRAVLTRQDWRPDDNSRGWGDSAVWMVTIANNAHFDVEILLQKPAAGLATLQIGRTTVKQDVNEFTRRIMLTDVHVIAGDGQLSFSLDDGKKKIMPYHVILHQKN